MIGKILMKVFWWLLVRGWIPDALLRWKIRSSLEEMLERLDKEDRDYQTRVQLEADFVKEISEQPIAVHQQEANDQHYEIPAEFYQICLGPKLKYSSCYFKVRALWSPSSCVFASPESPESKFKIKQNLSVIISGRDDHPGGGRGGDVGSVHHQGRDEERSVPAGPRVWLGQCGASHGWEVS